MYFLQKNTQPRNYFRLCGLLFLYIPIHKTTDNITCVLAITFAYGSFAID